MIVRIQFVVPLCSVVGYITTINGLYLNYATPKYKALGNLQNYPQDYSPRNFGTWFPRGRHHHKKLIILDRKNKRVNDFVKQLMSVIEMTRGDRLMNEDVRKSNCRHVSFGSIYNAKAKRKYCKNLHAAYKRKQPWIKYVIPIPVQRTNGFLDSTREGFADDYLMDVNRKDIDFDYFNTVHRAQPDDKFIKKDKETQRNTQTKVIAESNVDNLREPTRRDHTRFKIVPNKDSSGEFKGKKNKNPMPSDDSDTENTDDSDTGDESEHKSKQSDSDEPYKKPSRSKRPKMKYIKDEWNDIMNMPDTVPDSSEESSPPKQGKRNKKSYESKSSENEDSSNSDASTREENELYTKNYKDGSDNEKYVYLQGHRLYNGKNNGRRMRNKDYFLPKRSFWSEDTIKHLGPYWNSHEVAGVHVN